jgi:hypothetical protein
LLQCLLDLILSVEDEVLEQVPARLDAGRVEGVCARNRDVVEQFPPRRLVLDGAVEPRPVG